MPVIRPTEGLTHGRYWRELQAAMDLGVAIRPENCEWGLESRSLDAVLSFMLSIESSKTQLEAITSTEERRRNMLEARSDVLAKDVARSSEVVAAEVQAVYDASFDVTLHEYGEATTASGMP